ncbi:hypothetical protein FHU14_004516 [Mesorhizobium sp. RMAD-H1]|nr:hypothetical protein [Mesorhizobium sp. RMAD-H1]
MQSPGLLPAGEAGARLMGIERAPATFQRESAKAGETAP